MTISGKAKTLLAALVAVLNFSTAKAAFVDYQISDGGLDGSFSGTIDGAGWGGLAGGIKITQNPGAIAGGAYNPSMPASYVTLCTDISGTLYLGQTYQYAAPATTFLNQSGVNPNWGNVNTPAHGAPDIANAAQAIQNAAYLFYTYGGLTANGITGTPEQKAALQLAVWTALYDTDLTGKVTGSRFTVTGGDGGAISGANSLLTALNGQAGSGNFGYKGFLLYPDPTHGSPNVNGNGEPPQELLIAPVPEPSTVIAGALLGIPFVVGALRSARKAWAA